MSGTPRVNVGFGDALPAYADDVPPGFAWSAVAPPSFAPGTFALVNRASGRCLSVLEFDTPEVSAYSCNWADIPATQRWSTGAIANDARVTVVNVATGLALTRTFGQVDRATPTPWRRRRPRNSAGSCCAGRQDHQRSGAGCLHR